MRTQDTRILIGTALSSLLLIGSSAHSQILMIGGSTRNGNFEGGGLTPWGSGHDVQVLHDAAFASEGAYYASFQSSLVRPVLAGQNLLPNANQGLVFTLSFDARLGTPGLDVVSPLMSARTPGGAPLSASVIPILVPPLTTSAWQSYEYQLQMPAAWDGAGISFGISFNNNQPLGGVTHHAYLDNLILTQIPEPSTFALVACSALVAAAFRRVKQEQQGAAGNSR